MSSTLAGRVALVTGGARGIGAATCREVAALGAEVVVTDVLDNEGTALADELRRSGHKAFYRHLDVADEDAWSESVAEVIARSRRMTGSEVYADGGWTAQISPHDDRRGRPDRARDRLDRRHRTGAHRGAGGHWRPITQVSPAVSSKAAARSNRRPIRGTRRSRVACGP